MELEEHDLIGIFKMEGLWAIDLTSLNVGFLLRGSDVVVIIIQTYRISPLPSLASGVFPALPGGFFNSSGPFCLARSVLYGPLSWAVISH